MLKYLKASYNITHVKNTNLFIVNLFLANDDVKNYNLSDVSCRLYTNKLLDCYYMNIYNSFDENNNTIDMGDINIKPYKKTQLWLNLKQKTDFEQNIVMNEQKQFAIYEYDFKYIKLNAKSVFTFVGENEFEKINFNLSNKKQNFNLDII